MSRKKFSKDFKLKLLKEHDERGFNKGNISIQDLAHKHKILAPSTVRTWIKQYNDHEELTDSRKKVSTTWSRIIFVI